MAYRNILDFVFVLPLDWWTPNKAGLLLGGGDGNVSGLNEVETEGLGPGSTLL